MKIYVSVDIEGLPGVVLPTMTAPWSSQFQRASRIMTRLTNVLADEAFRNGASEVYVADSHGLMTNIDYLELDGRVNIIQGYPRAFSMVSLLDSTFNAIFYLGYHSAAGTPHGTLEHTYNGRVFSEIRVNGIRASEYILNSLYASEQGVPVAFLAGDEYLRKEVEVYTPWVVFVPLKKGVSRYSAISPGLSQIEKAIREGVTEAMSKVKENKVKLLEITKPYKVELVFRDSLIADALEEWDIMERLDAYTLRFTTDSARKMLAIISICSLVGSGIESLKANIR
ncbi:M55 family metallopeptidase [Pseudothermotoga thermarum]|uniref:D-aminopeptidase DppA n=1 Tax=Pseudothermotoga thermarum DSM 5069 TaxID=688269 RepID=F7YTU5_9THEM|nr:M55 family metallopeptidase [Pseudothermotoga thermarum]AEH51390.1 D-aminopeptidase DppA [Pseudothermotoga thermarum DSM 5069]